MSHLFYDAFYKKILLDILHEGLNKYEVGSTEFACMHNFYMRYTARRYRELTHAKIWFGDW